MDLTRGPDECRVLGFGRSWPCDHSGGGGVLQLAAVCFRTVFPVYAHFLSLFLSASLSLSRFKFEPGLWYHVKRREESLKEEMIFLIDILYNGGETLYRRGENMKMENTINQT